MAECTVFTDETGKELSEHGCHLFPFASYTDDPIIYPVAWHWHEELEAGIITEGSVLLEIPNQKLELHAGDGFFIGSEVLHSAIAGSITPCKFHSVVFHSSIVGSSKDTVFYQYYVQPILMNPAYDFVHLKCNQHMDALAYIQKAWQLHQDKQPGFEIKIRNELSEFLFSLQNLSLCENEMTRSEKKDVYRLKLILSYMELHYQENITLAMIASHANISESEVLRVFHNVMNTTPMKYLTQLRIQQATTYLTQTDFKISEIMALCGFQDISYFTKVFRQMKGMPPAAFRKLQRN